MSRPVFRLLLSSFLVLLTGNLASAQTLPAEGTKQLEDAWNNRDVRGAFTAMVRGEQQPAPNDANIETGAKFYAYRVTWQPYQKDTSGKMDALLKELKNEIGSALRNRPNTQAFLTQFERQLVLHLKEVLKNQLAIARVNAGRMLEYLGEVGDEDAADAMVEVLDDANQNDAVKFYALRGLKNLFVQAFQTSPVTFQNKDREARAILALIKFIERKPTVSPNATKEELDGYRFVRREAIRALGYTRYPAVEVKGKLEGRTAQVLLRVVVADGAVVPEPRLDERVEAALGVTRLKADLFKGYQPDYAARYVGTLVVYLAKPATRAVAGVPFKMFAAELQDGLNVLKADTKDIKTSAAYVNELVGRCDPILRAMLAGGNPNAGELDAWLTSQASPNNSLYAGVADATVSPGQREIETTGR
jgi:hypothetical protein